MKFFVVVSALFAAASAAPSSYVLPAGVSYAACPNYPYCSTVYPSGTPTAVAAPAVTLPAVPAAAAGIPGNQGPNSTSQHFA